MIHVLAGRVQDYLYLPNPDPLYLMLGVVAANMIKGPPVWMVMIGAPSAGKTIVMESLGNMAVDNTPVVGVAVQKQALWNKNKHIHIVGAIKGPSALLSGVPKKEMSSGATGGLLRQIGPHGMIVMKDLTSMLSLNRDAAGESISALREIFDGRYSRPLGTEGGRVLEWRGRVGFLAACTPVIDQHQALIGDLGERWVYYRYAETDGYGETIKALGVNDPALMMKDLRAAVEAFFDGLGLGWVMGGVESQDLDAAEKDRLYAMASFVCAARSGVPRDRFSQHQISDVALKESPPRIAGELGQLYKGLEAVGLDDVERWRLVGKVAMDSVRQTRAMAVGLCRSSRVPVKMTDMVQHLRVGRDVVRRTLEDLCHHGVIDRIGKKTGRMLSPEELESASGVGYTLSAWSRKQIKAGFGEVK